MNHFTALQVKTFHSSPIRLEKHHTIDNLRQLHQYKHELSHKYLNLIDHTTERWLYDNFEFILNALPQNYIDQRPSNLENVSHNLKIIKKCLDRHDLEIRKQLSETLVSPLRSEIDPLLEDYSNKLFSALNAFLVSFGVFHEREEIEKNFKKILKRNKINATTIDDFDVVMNCYKDLIYINEMRKIDIELWNLLNSKNSLENVQLGAPSDIVPVTGLIFAKLRRLENEHSTTLQHWQRKTSHQHHHHHRK